MEGRRPLADPAPSEHEATASDGASTEAKSPSTSSPSTSLPPKVDGTTFANTKQHVASRQVDGSTTERFTNTKLNIALINDPKNGPRFTMTKRESGLAGKDSDKTASTSSEMADGKTGTEAPAAASAPSTEGAASKGTEPATPSAKPDTAGSNDQAPVKTGEQTADTSKPEQPGASPPSAIAARLNAAPSGVPPAAQPPSKVPIDSSKTFVGPNGTYYDESWRWMDWRGTRQSWNWPAALSLGHWFAYRRLYMFAGLYLLWLAGLAAAVVNNVPVLALAAVALLIIGLTGIYGNTLYFLAFRRAVDHVTQKGKGSYQELTSQLAAAGGTSVVALGIMTVLTLSGIAGAIAVTYYIRRGFLFNLWPLPF